MQRLALSVVLSLTVLLLGAVSARATVWRGTAEFSYQTIPDSTLDLRFWRGFLEISAEDRIFVRNDIRLNLRLENRSFGGRQPDQFRPRFDLEMRGLSYNFRFYYAPFTLERVGGTVEHQRVYNSALLVYPAGWPQIGLTWNRRTNALDGVQNDRSNLYTLTASHQRGIWTGSGRILRQDRRITLTGDDEQATSFALRNDFAQGRRYWSWQMGHQIELLNRTRTSGLDQSNMINNLSARFNAWPTRHVSLGGDFSGRFTNTETNHSKSEGDNRQATARLNYRPYQFFEGALVHYYSRAATENVLQSELDYTQLQLSLNGSFFRNIMGIVSAYRTWNHIAVNTGDVNDALYVRLLGEVFRATSLSMEASYFNRNFGSLPKSLTRAVTLQTRPIHRADWQVQYASLGSGSDFSLARVERQNINLIFKQGISARSFLTLGTGWAQNTLISDRWLQGWRAALSVSIRRWALLAFNYNQLTQIRVVPGEPHAMAKPGNTQFALTLYPERGWVMNLSYFAVRNAVGRTDEIWAFDVRYQF